VSQQVATPTVVKKILRMKQEQPTMFAWEIREQLAQQGACDAQSLPSVSSVNRILRGGGLHTDIPAIEGGTSSGYASQISSNAGSRGEKRELRNQKQEFSLERACVARVTSGSSFEKNETNDNSGSHSKRNEKQMWTTHIFACRSHYRSRAAAPLQPNDALNICP